LSSGEEYGKPRLIDGVVLFADIRGFTSTSMTLPPDQLASELGGYLDEMVKVLLEHHAYVDKFIGDAVMGVWGFPFTENRQASEALACARKMVKKARGKRMNGAPVQIGVGLSAGTIFCGNIGSDLKRQFTVLGHDVNLAARCESACKDLNASIVLSEAVYTPPVRFGNASTRIPRPSTSAFSSTQEVPMRKGPLVDSCSRRATSRTILHKLLG
jgi:adenylate cyclase